MRGRTPLDVDHELLVEDLTRADEASNQAERGNRVPGRDGEDAPTVADLPRSLSADTIVRPATESDERSQFGQFGHGRKCLHWFQSFCWLFVQLTLKSYRKRVDHFVGVFLARPHLDPLAVGPTVPSRPAHRLMPIRRVAHLGGTVGDDHPPAPALDGQDDVGLMVQGGTVPTGSEHVSRFVTKPRALRLDAARPDCCE